MHYCLRGSGGRLVRHRSAHRADSSAGETDSPWLACNRQSGQGLAVESSDRLRASNREPLGPHDLTDVTIETRSLPTLARCYPRSFTFYVAHPIRSIQRTALAKPSRIRD